MDGILKEHNLIFGGDLNFTISTTKVWGYSHRIDLLDSYFNQLLREEGLTDVEPAKFLPTWRNGRGEKDFIAKRLDRFLINENLALSGYIYRTWVVNVNIFDHMSMIFQLDKEQGKIRYPFKFNSVYLDEP
jgi:hypothetical protein